MNRAELQQLADDRVLDATALLDAGRWSGAYYLAGYAVECGLKSCVIAFITLHPEIIIEARKFSEKCWTHNLEDLIVIADLKTSRDRDTSANPDFELNWQHVKDWGEIARYQRKSEAQARMLYEAVTDTKNGVLPWIKSRW